MARKLGLVASYLSIATIVFALVTATILTGAVIPSAAGIRCLTSGKHNYN